MNPYFRVRNTKPLVHRFFFVRICAIHVCFHPHPTVSAFHSCEVLVNSERYLCMENVPGLIESPKDRKRLVAEGYDDDSKRDAQIGVPFTVDQETFALPSIAPDLWSPGHELSILYFTWNMAQNPARPQELRQFGIRPIAHIIVVSTQENGPYVGTNDEHRTWRNLVETNCLDREYTVVGEVSMWALHILVLARTKDVAKYVREVETGSCKTGQLGGLFGNKGGVGVGLALSLRRSSKNRVAGIHPQSPMAVSGDAAFSPRELAEKSAPYQTAAAETAGKSELSLLFVGAHLTAHQHNTSKRNEDYAHIVRDLPLGLLGSFAEKFASPAHAVVPVSAASRDISEEYDMCLFAGDLNYRIQGTKAGIEFIVKHHKEMRAVLVANDQLMAERRKGFVFQNFLEGELHFRPTYKYHIDKTTKRTEDEYDFSQKKPRQPSFTDRVLYKQSQSQDFPLRLELYTDCPEVRTSDHRPVVALFRVGTRMYEDEGPEPPPVEPKRKSGSMCCC